MVDGLTANVAHCDVIGNTDLFADTPKPSMTGTEKTEMTSAQQLER